MAISTEKLLTLAQFQTGLQASKNYTDGQIAAVNVELNKKATQTALDETNGKVSTLETTVAGHTTSIGDNATAISNEVTRAKAAEEANAAAAAAADAKAVAAQNAADKAQDEVDALEIEVASVKGSVGTNTSDISTLKTKVQSLEEGTYDDTEVRGLISANAEAIEANEGAIADNTEAIGVLNGTGEGSVKKTVDDAINKFATDVTDDAVVNSYKELIDWAAEHGSDAAEMAAGIQTNANDIDALETGKADKATTLDGYGITNAYTKSETDSAITSAIDANVTINVATDDEVTAACNAVFGTTAA